MPRSYVPNNDAELLGWAQQLTELLIADPGDYGIGAGPAAALGAQVAEFATVLGTATNRVTRSPANIEIKNNKKDDLVAEVRRLVNIIQASPVMDNDKRAALGISLRDNEPTPVPVPQTAPQINVTRVVGRTIDIRLSDPQNPTRRAKPEGVMGASIFWAVGETAPDETMGWTFEGNVSRTTTKVQLPGSVAPGSKVWLISFWFNGKSESGPPSVAVSTFTQITEGGFRKAA